MSPLLPGVSPFQNLLYLPFLRFSIVHTLYSYSGSQQEGLTQAERVTRETITVCSLPLASSLSKTLVSQATDGHYSLLSLEIGVSCRR